MDLEIIKENENKLLGRKELTCKVKGIPTRKELVKKIAALKNSKEELIIVRKINHGFGEEYSLVNSRVYNDIESLKRVEPEYILKRHSPKEEKKENIEKSEEKTETPAKTEEEKVKEKK